MLGFYTLKYQKSLKFVLFHISQKKADSVSAHAQSDNTEGGATRSE